MTIRGDVREVFVGMEKPQVWMGVAVTRICKVSQGDTDLYTHRAGVRVLVLIVRKM